MKQNIVMSYSINELSEENRNKAIEKLIDLNVDYEWWDSIKENFMEDMETIGYHVSNIYFSGFYSQGDGACFEANVNILNYLTKNKLKTKYRKLTEYVKDTGDCIDIEQAGRYYHEKSMSFTDTFSSTDSKKLADQMTEIIERIEQEAEDKAKELYKTLEKKYEYLTSTEAIVETIEANEYEFTEKGELFS